MRFARDGHFQIILRATNWQIGCGIANVSEVIEMSMCMTSFAFRRGAERYCF